MISVHVPPGRPAVHRGLAGAGPIARHPGAADGRRADRGGRRHTRRKRTFSRNSRNGGAGRYSSDPASGFRHTCHRGGPRGRGWDPPAGDRGRRRGRQGRPGGRDGSSGADSVNTAANEPTGRTPMGDDAESPGEQTLSFEPIRDEEGTDLADAADRPTRPTVPRGGRTPAAGAPPSAAEAADGEPAAGPAGGEATPGTDGAPAVRQGGPRAPAAGAGRAEPGDLDGARPAPPRSRPRRSRTPMSRNGRAVPRPEPSAPNRSPGRTTAARRRAPARCRCPSRCPAPSAPPSPSCARASSGSTSGWTCRARRRPARSRRRSSPSSSDYVIPRVHMSTAPALVVVAGSTGAGKSTLVNTLARAKVERHRRAAADHRHARARLPPDDREVVRPGRTARPG